MSAENDPTFWKNAFEYAWAGVVVLGGVVWKGQNDKIHTLTTEQLRHRDVMAKIFDKLETNSQRAEDRHHELLTALHEGLSKKADK